MTEHDFTNSQTGRSGKARVLLNIVVCALLIIGAVAASYLIFASEPTAQSERATRRSAALVETSVAERGTYRPWLRVLGLVEPARNVLLSPRVSGHIESLEPAFVPGGLVQTGQPLLRIDPTDFERLVTVRMSEVRQVEAELAIEEGRQIAARQEFDLLGEEIDPANRSLVLREPQIEAIRARLMSARVALEQAELDLERTTVKAPFDAQILDRSVNVGSQVSPGDRLARLVGIEEAWVLARVPLRDLRWLRFPGDDEPGPPVRVRHTTAWAEGTHREGRLARLIGSVDEETRLAPVLVTVPDPLARTNEGPPLMLGTIVQLEIETRPLENVVRIERAWLRQNDTVWVMTNDELEIRTVDVVFRDAKNAYLETGVEIGEHVVTTDLATVTAGLPLRSVTIQEGETAEVEPGAAQQ